MARADGPMRFAVGRQIRGGYLGFCEVVDGYVRRFIMGVIDEVRATADGTKTRAQASAEVERLCEAAGRVFTGQDSDYTPIGPFHTEGHIMYAVRTRMAATFMGHPMVSPEQVVRDAFAVLAVEVYGFVSANVEGTWSDEDTQGRVNMLVEGWTTMLLGLPEGEGEDYPPTAERLAQVHGPAIARTTEDAGPTWEAGSKRRGVTADQVRLFARRLQDFLSEAHGATLRGLPSYERLIQAAYACGFVCHDFDLDRAMAVMRRVERDPAALLGMPFPRVRLYVHGLMRAERWNDCGADFGGGHIHEALMSGTLRHLAERLSRS